MPNASGDQRLTCGQHVIGFDPHSADGNESSFLDALQHAREQVWMFLFQPRILLGGTHRVREIRMHSSIRASTLDTVRATLRWVSRTGHSHAESICAWPTAT